MLTWVGNEKYFAFEQRISFCRSQPGLGERMASMALSVHSESSSQSASGYLSLTAAFSDEMVELDQVSIGPSAPTMASKSAVSAHWDEPWPSSESESAIIMVHGEEGEESGKSPKSEALQSVAGWGHEVVLNYLPPLERGTL